MKSVPEAGIAQSSPEPMRDKATRILTDLFSRPLTPFRTYGLQDSGCISWGVEVDDVRYLVKYTDHGQLNGLGERAVTALQGVVAKATEAHPDDRYASYAAFYDAWRAAHVPERASKAGHPAPSDIPPDLG